MALSGVRRRAAPSTSGSGRRPRPASTSAGRRRPVGAPRRDELGPDAELELGRRRSRAPLASVAQHGVGRRCGRRRRRARQGRMFMPGEPMKWPTKVCAGRSNSSSGVPICTTSPVVHHHDLVGEGQRLGLVVGDVDHRVRRAAWCSSLSLRAQLPLQVRVDDGQRLVEQDRRRRPRAPGRGRARSSALRRRSGPRRGGSSMRLSSSISAISRDARRRLRPPATPRLRSGKARLS